MQIDREKCIACGACEPYCPVGAIRVGETALVDQDACVECNVCYRSKVCPADAFVKEPLGWPREVRGTYSDPFGKHPSTQHMGRGTEEVKTNDVTNLVRYGQAGIVIEPGRPGVGATFRDVEKFTMALAPLGVTFAPRTPVTAFITDKATGKMREDVLDERALSAIVECVAPATLVPRIVAEVQRVAEEIETVFSFAIFYAAGPNGELPGLDYFRSLGLSPNPVGKVNVGLGRRTIKRPESTDLPVEQCPPARGGEPR